MPKLDRIYRGNDLDSDLARFKEAHLIDGYPPDAPSKRPFGVSAPLGQDFSFHHLFIEYVTEGGIVLQKVLVALVFSDFQSS